MLSGLVHMLNRITERSAEVILFFLQKKRIGETVHNRW